VRHCVRDCWWLVMARHWDAGVAGLRRGERSRKRSEVRCLADTRESMMTSERTIVPTVSFRLGRHPCFQPQSRTGAGAGSGARLKDPEGVF